MLEEQYSPITVDDADFGDRVLASRGLAVVDFWAPWCGPCRSMAPGLEAFARKNGGCVKVFKLDVEENPKTAEKYDIRSVPTVIFFRDGEPLEMARGALSEAALQSRLEALLG